MYLQFIDNPQVRDGIKEWCKNVNPDASPDQIAGSLAAQIVPRRPANWRGPHRDAAIRSICKTLARWIDVYLDLQQQPGGERIAGTHKLGKLPPKKMTISEDCYVDLTEKQRQVVSLILEHGLSISAVARRLGKHRSTIEEHYRSALNRIDQYRSAHARQKNRARPRAIPHPQIGPAEDEAEDNIG